MSENNKEDKDESKHEDEVRKITRKFIEDNKLLFDRLAEI